MVLCRRVVGSIKLNILQRLPSNRLQGFFFFLLLLSQSSPVLSRPAPSLLLLLILSFIEESCVFFKKLSRFSFFFVAICENPPQ